MKLPNWFRIVWWIVLLAILTGFLWARVAGLQSGEAGPADIVVFLAWLGLALAPIFPDVRLFGMHLKQDVDQIKKDVAALRLSQSQYVSINNVMTVASQHDLDRKFAEEERQAISAHNASDSAQMESFLLSLKHPGTIREQVRGFHAAALQAVRSGRSPIKFDTFNEELVLDDGRTRDLLDALASTPETHYVIEIKYLLRPSAMLDAAAQLLALARQYREYITQRRVYVDIVPVLIVPSSVNVPIDRLRFIPVLKYDAEEKSFVNADQFRKMVERCIGEVTPPTKP